MRVLITGSRNTFALDMSRKLGSAGHTVVATDTYDGALGNHSKYVTAHAVTASPRFDTDQFITDISDLVDEHGIDLILPTFEEAFYLSARRADLPDGATLFTGRFDKLAKLHDKVSFQRLAGQAGVPVPETVVATDDASLAEAAAKFPRYFARAAFSRGGVGLLTNTGPLAGQVAIGDCHPTKEQPWLVQPFVDGPMVCTYSTVVDGKVTAHSTYRAPEQWDHSTGIGFESIDSTETLDYTRRFVAALDPGYMGQLSFDFVNHEGQLYAIECNPRSTNGVLVMEAEPFANALTAEDADTYIVPAGVQRQLSVAVLAEAVAEPWRDLSTTLHDLVHVKDIGAGWHDSLAMMWSPATLVHGAKLGHGKHKALLAALADDIVWNGEPIAGMSPADLQALDAVHQQRI